jgi:hypothetical protein
LRAHCCSTLPSAVTSFASPRRASLPPGRGDGTSLRAGIRLLIDTLDRTPAVLLSRRLDLLYWNPVAEALGPFPDHGNYARMVFRDQAQRALHADWEEAARQTVALLQYAAARHPEDVRLRAPRS